MYIHINTSKLALDSANESWYVIRVINRERKIMKLSKSHLQKLVTDLYWEYEKMTSSGKETLDKIAKVLDLPTQEEMDFLIANMSEEELYDV